MSCMGPSVVAGLTTVGALVGRAGPWPTWLPGPAPCRGCQPTGGQAGLVPAWLAVRPGVSQGCPTGCPIGWQGQVSRGLAAGIGGPEAGAGPLVGG